MQGEVEGKGRLEGWKCLYRRQSAFSLVLFLGVLYSLVFGDSFNPPPTLSDSGHSLILLSICPLASWVVCLPKTRPCLVFPGSSIFLFPSTPVRQGWGGLGWHPGLRASGGFTKHLPVGSHVLKPQKLSFKLPQGTELFWFQNIFNCWYVVPGVLPRIYSIVHPVHFSVLFSSHLGDLGGLRGWNWDYLSSEFLLDPAVPVQKP